MTETETPQEQPQAGSGLTRLEEAFSETPVETKQEVPEKEETPETGFTDKPAETETPAKEEEKAEEVEEFVFKDETQEEEDGWKPWLKEFGFEIPEDYSEDKAPEYIKQQFEKQKAEAEERARSFSIAEIISKYPEERQGEAKMYLDLMMAGKTLEEIQAPLMQVREYKSMPKEALVRWALEQTQGFDEEMVNMEMEKLTATPQLLDTKHKIVLAELDNYEKSYIQQMKSQAELHNTQVAQLREQKKAKEFDDFKKALDREKAFMDVKLSESNKSQLLTKFQQGYKDQLVNDPNKLIRFMLYETYGEQALQYAQSRAIEKAALKEAQKKHNIPSKVVSTGGGRATPSKTYDSGMARLEEIWNQTGAV